MSLPEIKRRWRSSFTRANLRILKCKCLSKSPTVPPAYKRLTSNLSSIQLMEDFQHHLGSTLDVCYPSRFVFTASSTGSRMGQFLTILEIDMCR